MRVYSYISIIVLSVIMIFTVHNNPMVALIEYPCPPYHEETRPVLENFLTSENFREMRERFGIDKIESDEISYLKEHEGCRPSVPPGPRSGDFLTTYYKSNEFYFRVDYFNRPHAEKVGDVYNFNLVPHSLAVYDRNFEAIGGVLL